MPGMVELTLGGTHAGWNSRWVELTLGGTHAGWNSRWVELTHAHNCTGPTVGNAVRLHVTKTEQEILARRLRDEEHGNHACKG
jgi:hypothetical protein